MKFTHRTVGPRKGTAFSPVTKVSGPPKARKGPDAANVTNYQHTGPFASLRAAFLNLMPPDERARFLYDEWKATRGGDSGDPPTRE